MKHRRSTKSESGMLRIHPRLSNEHVGSDRIASPCLRLFGSPILSHPVVHGGVGVGGGIRGISTRHGASQRPSVPVPPPRPMSCKSRGEESNRADGVPARAILSCLFARLPYALCFHPAYSRPPRPVRRGPKLAAPLYLVRSTQPLGFRDKSMPYQSAGPLRDLDPPPYRGPL